MKVIICNFSYASYLYSVIPCLVYGFFIVSISKAKLGRELSIQALILLLALEMNSKTVWTTLSLHEKSQEYP